MVVFRKFYCVILSQPEMYARDPRHHTESSGNRQIQTIKKKRVDQ